MAVPWFSKQRHCHRGWQDHNHREVRCGPWPGSSVPGAWACPHLLCPWLPMRLWKPQRQAQKFSESCNTCQKKRLMVTRIQDSFPAFSLCLSLPSLGHRCSQRLSVIKNPRSSQLVCLECTPIQLGWRISLPLLFSKTVNKLENPMETTSNKLIFCEHPRPKKLGSAIICF